MSDFVKAPDHLLADRNQLADHVCRELQRAGIPAFRTGDVAELAGAEVQVDPGDDAAGGVFVDWHPDPDLSRAVAESVQNEEFSAPVIQHFGAISTHMQDAILGILRSAGFQVEVARDDMRPMVIHVAGR